MYYDSDEKTLRVSDEGKERKYHDKLEVEDLINENEKITEIALHPVSTSDNCYVFVLLDDKDVELRKVKLTVGGNTELPDLKLN